MLRRYTVLFAVQSILALADRIEAELGWSFLHNVQAYQTDGDKTTAFEICEQLRWQAPAAVFVPTGTGTKLFGLWQGFVLFKELGFIDALPRMFAVQPVGADSLVAAWEAHQDIPIAMDSTKPNLAPRSAIASAVIMPIKQYESRVSASSLAMG